MSNSVNRPPNQRVGGSRIELLINAIDYELSAPIWMAGVPLERDPSDLTKLRKKANLTDIRLKTMGVSMVPSYPHFAYGEFPATFTASPESSAFTHIAVVKMGVVNLMMDSDHGTAFERGEDVQVVLQNQTVEGETLSNFPCVAPISTLVGGAGWGVATLGDTGTLDGENWRDIQQVLGTYLGEVDEDVGATLGVNTYKDVVLLVPPPLIGIPSA